MNAATPQLHAAVRTFTQQLSYTPRGARLARLLTYEQVRTWQTSPDVTDRAEQIVAELTANAALHGRVGPRPDRRHRSRRPLGHGTVPALRQDRMGRVCLVNGLFSRPEQR